MDNLTETGIYTISSESGVTINGLPSTSLQYGDFYIRVTANNIGTNNNEIIQEIINAGSSPSTYIREKIGVNWNKWHGIPQKELLWSGVATVTNPYSAQGYTHIETSGITNVEISDTSVALSAFVASHEVIVSVSNASATSTIPPVTTGYTFGVTTDEITGKKVVKINVVLENMTAAGTPGTAYYVSYKLYKVN